MNDVTHYGLYSYMETQHVMSHFLCLDIRSLSLTANPLSLQPNLCDKSINIQLFRGQLSFLGCQLSFQIFNL